MCTNGTTFPISSHSVLSLYPSIACLIFSIVSCDIFKKYSAIGVNSTVLPGVILAEGSVLGANSLLTKDTEPWTIYVGSPAKPVGIRDKEWILESSRELGYDL